MKIAFAIAELTLTLVGCEKTQMISAPPAPSATATTVTAKVVAAPTAAIPVPAPVTVSTACTRTTSIIVIPLTAAKHRAVIAHANLAIRTLHYPRVMVLNRDGATARRAAITKGIPTKAGFDRDEYPAAAGRKINKAHVAYVNSTQNRSAGAIMGNKLRPYCNGVKFIYAGT